MGEVLALIAPKYNVIEPYIVEVVAALRAMVFISELGLHKVKLEGDALQEALMKE